MTQDERWMVRYNEVKAFIEGNKRRLSKYALEERNAWNWLTVKALESGTVILEVKDGKYEPIGPEDILG